MWLALFLLLIPSPQFTWSNGALSGNHLILNIAEAGQPAAPRDCVVIGLNNPRMPGPDDTIEDAAILTRFQAVALAGLSSLTSGGLLFVVPLREEMLTDCAVCDAKPVLAVSLYVQQGSETANVAELMLKAGLVYWPRLAIPELSPAENAFYEAAQAEAAQRGRGLWRYKESLWRVESGARGLMQRPNVARNQERNL